MNLFQNEYRPLKAMYFPLSMALAAFWAFWFVVFSLCFFKVFSNFHWNYFFDLRLHVNCLIFKHFRKVSVVFFCCWFLAWFYSGWRPCSMWFQPLEICWDLFHGSENSFLQWMCHVHWKECIFSSFVTYIIKTYIPTKTERLKKGGGSKS